MEVIGTVQKRSQELRSIGADFGKSLKVRQHKCCAQVMTGKWSGVLPVAYYPLHTTEYASAFLVSDWLYFLWHRINIF